MGVIGQRVVRVEDPRFLTGAATFTDDIELPGALHVVFVRSPLAHGRLRRIDTGPARAMSGVVAVFTAADLPAKLARFPADARALHAAMIRPFLATDTVRYVGEPVAAVVATTRAAGRDGADAVELDLEPLPPLIDPQAALAPGAPLLHPAAGTNECFSLPPPKTGPVAVDDCEVVIRARYRNQRLAPCTLEPRAGAAAWLQRVAARGAAPPTSGADAHAGDPPSTGDPSGTSRPEADSGERLTLWVTSQGPWPVHRAVTALYDLPPAAVRVISPDVGGGFGAKEALYPEILLLPWLARQVARPVRWAEDRSESMVNLGHGRGQHQEVALGGGRDGRLLAYHLDVIQDAGAYPRLGATLPFLTRLVLCGPYRIPAAACTARAAVTSTTPVLAYRGAGQPEAVAALERTIDQFAAEIGLDPAEVRRRNLLSADDHPWVSATGATYDSGHPDLAFEQCLERLDYDRWRARQAARRREGGTRQLGIGLACFSEVIGGADPSEFGEVTVHADGRVDVRAGSFSHGQGHETTWAMVVAERLGVPLSRVRVVDGDTDAVRQGGNTGGSRSVQTAGNALAEAADAVVAQARALAADLLEARADDVVLDTERGVFHVLGTPALVRTWSDVAMAAAHSHDDGPGAVQSADGERGAAALRAEAQVGQPPRSTFTCGAHAAVVEVDTETGAVWLCRLVAVTDAGRILNPLLAEGQIHGGVAQGVGQALTEEVVYDEAGNPLTATFADYGVISAAELVPIDVSFIDVPAPLGALGAKGLGESGAIGSTAAVLNAVADALAPLGVRDVGLPVTAERVWRAIADARGSG